MALETSVEIYGDGFGDNDSFSHGGNVTGSGGNCIGGVYGSRGCYHGFGNDRSQFGGGGNYNDFGHYDYSHDILGPGREKTLDVKALALQSLPNYKTRVAAVAPAAAAATIAVAEVDNYCRKTKCPQRRAREETGRRLQVTKALWTQPCTVGGRAWMQQRRHVLHNTHVCEQKSKELYC